MTGNPCVPGHARVSGDTFGSGVPGNALWSYSSIWTGRACDTCRAAFANLLPCSPVHSVIWTAAIIKGRIGDINLLNERPNPRYIQGPDGSMRYWRTVNRGNP